MVFHIFLDEVHWEMFPSEAIKTVLIKIALSPPQNAGIRSRWALMSETILFCKQNLF